MKKLIFLFLFLFVVCTTVEAKRNHNHNKSHMLVNKIKYQKRNHQNRIFQSFLQSSDRRTFTMTQSFAPRGAKLYPRKHW